MNGKIILDGITAAALVQSITEAVVLQLKEAKEPEVLMTREETVKYLKIGTATLSRWTSEGRLKGYGMGGRVYYKRSEIESSMELIKV